MSWQSDWLCDDPDPYNSDADYSKTSNDDSCRKDYCELFLENKNPSYYNFMEYDNTDEIARITIEIVIMVKNLKKDKISHNDRLIEDLLFSSFDLNVLEKTPEMIFGKKKAFNLKFFKCYRVGDFIDYIRENFMISKILLKDYKLKLDKLRDRYNGHIIENSICIRCGCSEIAINNFNFKCK